MQKVSVASLALACIAAKPAWEEFRMKYGTSSPPTPPNGLSSCCYGEASDTCGNVTVCPSSDFCSANEDQCSQCKGMWCGPTAQPSVTTTPQPAGGSTTPTPVLTTPQAAPGNCCYGEVNATSCDAVSTCPPNDFCGESEDSCLTCQGVWCPGHLASSEEIIVDRTPGPAPPTTSPPTPPAGPISCCYGEATDTCGNVTVCPPSDFCGANEDQCSQCKGMWCGPTTPSPVTTTPQLPPGNCCYGEVNATSCDAVSTCPPNDFCGESEDSCLSCQGVWCPGHPQAHNRNVMV